MTAGSPQNKKSKFGRPHTKFYLAAAGGRGHLYGFNLSPPAQVLPLSDANLQLHFPHTKWPCLFI
jgi:hypothetical protein